MVRRGPITHHGICVEPDRVVQYGGFSGGLSDMSKGGIEEVYLGEFLQGRPLMVRHYRTPRRRYNQGTTVWRAQSRLGENVYNVLDNNCEHFATWCVTGEDRSDQTGPGIARPFEWLRPEGGRYEDAPWEHFVYNLYHPWEWDFDDTHGHLHVP